MESTIEVTKIDDKTIEITKTTPVRTVNRYNIDFLISQKQSIKDQKEKDGIKRDVESAEVDELIQKCMDLGVVATSINSEILLENNADESAIV